MSYPHIFWEGATTNSTQIVNCEQGGWTPCLAMKRYNSFHINTKNSTKQILCQSQSKSFFDMVPEAHLFQRFIHKSLVYLRYGQKPFSA